MPAVCWRATQPLTSLAGLRSAAFFEGPLQSADPPIQISGAIILADSLAACWRSRRGARPGRQPGDSGAAGSEARLATRGYNQAGAAGTRVCRAAAGGVWPRRALRRWRETPSQVGLSAGSGMRTSPAPSQASARSCAGQSIILVDDVCTTGATLAALRWRAVGRRRDDQVWGLTLARARLAGTPAGTKHWRRWGAAARRVSAAGLETAALAGQRQ